MNGEGFAFFQWRVLRHPFIKDDASWWLFWLPYDLGVWITIQGKVVDRE
jgi:hypothetical protein